MDESDTEVQVGQVAADQTQTEENTNGDNGAQVDAARHLDSLAAVEEVGVACQDLRHDRGKGQVVGGQDHGVAWGLPSQLSMPGKIARSQGRMRLTELERVQNPLVEENNRRRAGNPDAAEVQVSETSSLRCARGRGCEGSTYVT